MQQAEEYVRRQNEQIPKYIKSGMTREQMQDAIVAHIKESKQTIWINGRYLSLTDIDGRFPEAKDSRYSELIRSLNATDMTKLPGMPRINGDRESAEYRKLQRRVEDITSRYKTKELREFITSELGEPVYRGGRPEYLTTITLRMNERFMDRGGRGLVRSRLGQPSSKVRDFVASLKQAVQVRDVYAERAAEIRAKYKGVS